MWSKTMWRPAVVRGSNFSHQLTADQVPGPADLAGEPAHRGPELVVKPPADLPHRADCQIVGIPPRRHIAKRDARTGAQRTVFVPAELRARTVTAALDDGAGQVLGRHQNHLRHVARERARCGVAPEAQLRRSLQSQALGELGAQESRDVLACVPLVFLSFSGEPEPRARAVARELDHRDHHAVEARVAHLVAQDQVHFFPDSAPATAPGGSPRRRLCLCLCLRLSIGAAVASSCP